MREFLKVILCLVACGIRSSRCNSTYSFYRDIGETFANDSKSVYFKGPFSRRRGEEAHGRRVFGGTAAALGTFPTACALLDRYFTARCTAAVLAPHWALTAAHCATSVIAYIKYNTRHSASDEGDVVVVHYLYQHPEFRVLQEDLGKGLDVTLLHHDVGLVRTRDRIKLLAHLTPDPLTNIRRYDPMSLVNEEVQVLGFGETESTPKGEELWVTRLVVVACGRKEWYHVVCGAEGAGGARGGVCSGDSGGPVVFGGAQVAVTSMGPRECARLEAPDRIALSVFTSLRPYLDILNATMADTDHALTMRMTLNACPPPPTLSFDTLVFLFSYVSCSCETKHVTMYRFVFSIALFKTLLLV